MDKKIPSKKLAIYALKDGNTKQQEIELGMQDIQALTDEQILQLEHIDRKIEEHFGTPQDIEWCLAHNVLYSPSLKRMIKKIAFTYLSVINK